MNTKKLIQCTKHAVFCLLVFSSPLLAKEKPIFAKTFLAQGMEEMVFSITEWGRFSIQVENPEGTSLHLIDRKVGLRQKDGIPGERNGRIDLFLDVGEYKIITYSHVQGTQEATVRVFPFVELNRDQSQYLKPLRIYQATVQDCEQVSYWVYIDVETPFFAEIVGRHVADVQLWKDGQWRVDINKKAITATSVKERPLKGYRIVDNLAPGYYQLTVYGGKPVTWAQESANHPVYIQWEVKRIPASGMGSYTINPTGYNQYAISYRVRNIELSCSQKKERLIIQVHDFPQQSPTLTGGWQDSIHEKLTDPRCLIRTRSKNSGFYLIKVSGKPGQTFSLKTLELLKPYLAIKSSGNYWISTLHTGFPQDQFGVSGFLANGKDQRIKTALVDTISGKHNINRRFNLLDKMYAIIAVKESGKYDFIPGNTDMTISLQRLLFDKKVKALKSFSQPKTILLEKGLYQLTLSPVKKGIATLAVKKSSVLGKLKKLVGLEGEFTQGRPCLQIPSINLSPGERNVMLVNSLKPELTGCMIRRLPLDLNEPLPVYLDSKDEISIPIRVSETSRFYIEDPDGKGYYAWLDNKKYSSGDRLEPGSYTLKLEPVCQGYVFIRTVPFKYLPDAKPDPFPTGDESPLTLFPEIKVGTRKTLDLSRNDAKVYEFSIYKAGIYRFETHGRLKTRLTLRDRFIVKLHNQVANGIGRNALILAYFLPGRYQTEVSTQGKSCGHLGISIKVNKMLAGGVLTEKHEKRHFVPAGAGIEYSVPISQEGTYTLVSQGQSSYFRARLEDEEGWPEIDPGAQANINKRFTPGNYRFISLPENYDRLRLARITRTKETTTVKGKGPHKLELNRAVSAVWMEELEKETRQPDLFHLDLPASCQSSWSLSQGFLAIVYNQQNDTLAIWQNSLDTLLNEGQYKIEIQAEKRQNLAKYQLQVTTSDLLNDLSYSLSNLSQAVDFNVRVGQQSVIELFSKGMWDVKAELFDSTGKHLLAENDDATNSWNFKISQVMSSGKYTLRVSSSGKTSGRTHICMSSLPDTVHTTFSQSQKVSLNLQGKINRLPLAPHSEDRIFTIIINGESQTGCLLEKQIPNKSYAIIGERQGQDYTFSVPLEANDSYRLSLWSLDHLNEKVDFLLHYSSWKSVTLQELKRGIRGKPEKLNNFGFLWYQLDLGADSLNHFDVNTDQELEQVSITSRFDQPFSAEKGHFFGTYNQNLWLECVLKSSKRGKIRITPFSLDQPITLEIAQKSRVFTIPFRKKSATVITATMKTGKPMSGILTAQSAELHPHGFPVYSGIAFPSRKTCAVHLPDDSPSYVVWNALARKVYRSQLVSLHKQVIPLNQPMALPYGHTVWEASSSSSQQYRIDNIPVIVQVSLPHNGIALWKGNDGTRRLEKSEKEVEMFTFRESNGTLVLINPGSAAQYTIACLVRGSETAARLTSTFTNNHFEHYFSRPGKIRITLDTTLAQLKDAFLLYEGVVKNIDWWSGDGTFYQSISSGYQLLGQGSVVSSPSCPAGYFLIDHGQGWIKSDLCAPDQPGCQWGETLEPKDPISLTQAQELVLKDGVNWFTITLDKRQHLRFTASRTLAVVLVKDNAVLTTITGLGVFEADFPLAQGTYTIGIRSLNQEKISGTRVTYAVQEIEEITGDQSSSLLLAAGESKILRFALDQDRKVGIGIQANREVVKVKLYNHALTLIKEGQQQFIDLLKGEYFLGLQVPPEAESVACTVRLWGRNPLPDVPPDHVVKKFKEFK